MSNEDAGYLQSNTYKTGPEAKAGIEWMKGFESKFRKMCSISEGLLCHEGRCQDSWYEGMGSICTDVSRITGNLYRWTEDLIGCGDLAKCDEKPDKPLSEEDGKYLKEKLKDVLGDSGREKDSSCMVHQNSLDVVIKFGELILQPDYNAYLALERYGVQTHNEARKLTYQITRESLWICSATKNLVCIPKRIDLKNWSEKEGTCKLCSEVANDTTYDLQYS